MKHRHYSIDIPPRFCEECGKDWALVMDGRTGRAERRSRGPLTDADRFWRKVDKTDKCWEWKGTLNSYGYGRVDRKVDGVRRQLPAHRVAYELLVGPIPDGLTIDHLCRNKRCVRPDHLEPVTDRVNILRSDGISAQMARRDRCDRGHLFDGRRRTRNGKPAERWCSVCAIERNRRWRQERKAS